MDSKKKKKNFIKDEYWRCERNKVLVSQSHVGVTIEKDAEKQREGDFQEPQRKPNEYGKLLFTDAGNRKDKVRC